MHTYPFTMRDHRPVNVFHPPYITDDNANQWGVRVENKTKEII